MREYFAKKYLWIKKDTLPKCNLFIKITLPKSDKIYCQNIFFGVAKIPKIGIAKISIIGLHELLGEQEQILREYSVKE